MHQKLYKFLLILTGLNLLQAIFTGLAYDEAYYWLYSKNLDWGYFDHPPMVALGIWIGTLFSDHEFFVRLMPSLWGLFGLFYIWNSVENKNVKYFATFVLTLPLVHSAGLIAIPDTPLFMFTAMFFYGVKKYIEKDNWKYAALLALVITGMFYSKYHAILTVLVTAFAYPAFFKRKTFWLCVGLVVIFYIPHLCWQYQNDFVTFDYHLFGRPKKTFRAYYVFEILGAIIIASGFTLFPGIVRLLKEKADDSFNKILKVNILFFWIFLFVLSFRNPTEANWLLSTMIPLIIYTMNNISKVAWVEKYFTRLALAPIAMMIIMRLMILDIWNEPSFSRYYEMNDWKKHIDQIESKAGDLPIVSNHYQFAAKISYERRKPIKAWHYKTRSSQFERWEFNKVEDNETFLFLTKKKLKGSEKIDLKYRGPLYMIRGTKEEIKRLF
jgi:hypothetical protein